MCVIRSGYDHKPTSSVNMAKDKQAKKAIKPSKADKGKGPAPIPAAAQPAATLSLVKQVDPELDDIFAKSVSPGQKERPPQGRAADPLCHQLFQASFALPPPKPASPTAAPTAGSSSRKRKLPDQPESSNKAARRATSEPMVADGSDDGDDDEGEELDNDADLSELDEDEAGLLDALEDEDGMPSELGEDPDEDERDSEDETPKTVTAAEGAKAPSATKKGKDKPRKYTPPGETREQKDARTVFVGNVPVEAVKNKALQKQLSRLIAALAPTSKVESMRFRSVAFAAPTAPEDDEDKEKKLSRERERAAAWKREHAAEAASASSRSKPKIADSEVEQSKTFFRPGERRRVAFIKKDLHPDVEVANAYIVFAHPAPDRSANVAPMMDPTEAAAQVVRQAHETPVIFEGRTLRIDAVRATLATIASTAAESGTSTLPLKRRVWTAGKDPKMSLYVGNLVYAAKEDDLRAFVESLVVGEKGPAPEGGAWVEDVRIIRDRDTQMGKGFAYVAMRVSRDMHITAYSRLKS